jgi:hypothetical protein
MDFDRTIVSNGNGWEYGGFGVVNRLAKDIHQCLVNTLCLVIGLRIIRSFFPSIFLKSICHLLNSRIQEMSFLIVNQNLRTPK